MTVFNGHHRIQERIELQIKYCKKTIQNNITRTVLTVKRWQMSYTLHGAMTARAQKNKSTNRKKRKVNHEEMTNETPEQVKQIQPDNQLGLEEYQEKPHEEHEKSGEPEIPETVPISTQEVEAASPRHEPSKRFLEGMSMIELKNSVHEEFCNHCKMALTGDPQHRAVKKGSAKKICRQCHNTVTLLYKNVDVSKLQWGEVPEEKMTDFFREAKSMAACQDGWVSPNSRLFCNKRSSKARRCWPLQGSKENFYHFLCGNRKDTTQKRSSPQQRSETVQCCLS